jgi:hypothetical protein
MELSLGKGKPHSPKQRYHFLPWGWSLRFLNDCLTSSVTNCLGIIAPEKGDFKVYTNLKVFYLKQPQREIEEKYRKI